jgi:hypothetical protein
MTMKNRRAGALCVAAAIAMAAGCSSPAAPTTTASPPPSVSETSAFVPVPSTAPITTGQTVTVTDGWTAVPVAGARVSVNGTELLTTANGTVPVAIAAGQCQLMDIVAMGFLRRRTCARASVTLWAIANDAEATATHDAAFVSSNVDRMMDPSRTMNDRPVFLAANLATRPEVTAAWDAAAAELKSATGNNLTVRFDRTVPYDDGYLVSAAPSSPLCRHGWFTWQFAIAGFCWEPTGAYFVQDITVDPSLVDHPDVALRALLYAFTLRPHQLRGLMNATHPATELSPFERKTLHMMGLRWPTPVTWPDLESGP